MQFPYGYQGEGCRQGIVRELVMDMYTRLYLKWITNEDLQYTTGNSAECYVAAWMGGALGRMDMLSYASETIKTLLILL